MKKRLIEIFWVIIIGLAVASSCVLLLDTGGSNREFLKTTGLDQMAMALENGATIKKVIYDNRIYGAASWFITEDQEELQALWEAIRVIRLGKTGLTGRTDWYPEITFFLDDGSEYSINFDGHLLNHDGKTYRLHNDLHFWSLTEKLTGQYALQEQGEGDK